MIMVIPQTIIIIWPRSPKLSPPRTMPIIVRADDSSLASLWENCHYWEWTYLVIDRSEHWNGAGRQSRNQITIVIDQELLSLSRIGPVRCRYEIPIFLSITNIITITIHIHHYHRGLHRWHGCLCPGRGSSSSLVFVASSISCKSLHCKRICSISSSLSMTPYPMPMSPCRPASYRVPSRPRNSQPQFPGVKLRMRRGEGENLCWWSAWLGLRCLVWEWLLRRPLRRRFSGGVLEVPSMGLWASSAPWLPKMSKRRNTTLARF